MKLKKNTMEIRKKNGHPFTTVVHRRFDKFLPSKMANFRLSHCTGFIRGGYLYKFPKDHEIGPCLTCGLTFAMMS